MYNNFCYVCFFLVIFIIKDALAITLIQKTRIQAKFLASGIECINDYPLTANDIQILKSKVMPENENANCFVNCLFKKIGIMDDMGKMTQAGAREFAKQVFKDDDENVKKTDELYGQCSSVNEKSVSDGDKGCDRARLAFICLAENAPKFGLDVDF
uniref:Odorant-binding protein 19 n=1 Tax=Streltzoviella insularis TaxID=1206366 RepID=A0A7D5YJW3_9NEOP|nr:odorant-binding protein 19 [Streltzoviella insularis]